MYEVVKLCTEFFETFFSIIVYIFTSRREITIFALQNEFGFYLFDIESVNDNIINSRCFFFFFK